MTMQKVYVLLTFFLYPVCRPPVANPVQDTSSTSSQDSNVPLSEAGDANSQNRYVTLFKVHSLCQSQLGQDI